MCVNSYEEAWMNEDRCTILNTILILRAQTIKENIQLQILTDDSSKREKLTNVWNSLIAKLTEWGS